MTDKRRKPDETESAETDAGRKPGAMRLWVGAGIGAGIGSAAIAAALLYANRDAKKPPRKG